MLRAPNTDVPAGPAVLRREAEVNAKKASAASSMLAIARSCLMNKLRPCQTWVSDVTDVKETERGKQEDRENGG